MGVGLVGFTRIYSDDWSANDENYTYVDGRDQFLISDWAGFSGA